MTSKNETGMDHESIRNESRTKPESIKNDRRPFLRLARACGAIADRIGSERERDSSSSYERTTERAQHETSRR